MEPAPSPLYPELENLGTTTRFIEDIFDAIEHIPLFDGFSYPEIQQVFGYMECFGAPAGMTLLREGQEGGYLLLILTGSARVTDVDGDGAVRQIAVVGPGGTIGEMSLVDGRSRCARCMTLEPTDFAVLTRLALDGLLADHARLGGKFLLVLLSAMTRELRRANEYLLPHIHVSAV